MIYFTSDTHFWHKAVIGYCNRPAKDVQEMNDLLIQRWNERVKDQDEVYFLGDFAFCGTTKALDILEQLKGKKYAIRGNHDHTLFKKDPIKDHFVWIRDYYNLRVQDVRQSDEEETDISYHQPIILCHFPILSWDGMARGAWHLHGHCHGSLPSTRAMRLDVGVDTNNLSPYSYEEIKKIMTLRSFVPVDHHGF
jgi:calcineurin-like phosphoesterase family protein